VISAVFGWVQTLGIGSALLAASVWIVQKAYDQLAHSLAQRRTFVQETTKRVVELSWTHYWALANAAGTLAGQLQGYLRAVEAHLFVSYIDLGGNGSDGPARLQQRLQQVVTDAADGSFPNLARMVMLFHRFQFGGSNTYLLPHSASGEALRHLYNRFVGSLPEDPFLAPIRRQVETDLAREPKTEAGNPPPGLSGAFLEDTERIRFLGLDKAKERWGRWLAESLPQVHEAGEALQAYADVIAHELAQLNAVFFRDRRGSPGAADGEIVKNGSVLPMRIAEARWAADRWPGLITRQSLLAIARAAHLPRDFAPLGSVTQPPLRPTPPNPRTATRTAPRDASSDPAQRIFGPDPERTNASESGRASALLAAAAPSGRRSWLGSIPAVLRSIRAKCIPRSGVSRSRLVSVRAIAGNRRQRIRPWIEGVLHRITGRRRRLAALRADVRDVSRFPFKAAAAVAEIQRFLVDPAAYQSPETVWLGAEEGLAGDHIRHVLDRRPDGKPYEPGLAGDHIRHVLDAQALAFSNRARESAEAMKRALDQLGSPPDSQATAAVRHRTLLRALGESFRRDQELLASKVHGMVEEDRQTDGTEPLLPYLEQQRARRRLFQERFKAATDAFERAVAVAGPVSADDRAAYAIEIARIAVRAAEAGSSDAKSLLGLSATRWLDPAAERAGETQLVGILAYWQGRVALAQAEADEEAEAGRNAASRAIDRLSEVRRLDPSSAEAAESWLPEARRQLVLHSVRLGDAQPLAEALRREGELSRVALPAVGGELPPQSRQEGDRSTVAPAAAESFTLSWSALASSFKEIGTPFGQKLIQLAAANLMQKRIMPPPVAPRRLVLEVSENALRTDPEAKRLIGREVEANELDEEGLAPDDRSSPDIRALRRLLWSRFRVSLPGTLVRPLQSDEPLKRIRVLLDNIPVHEAVWAMEAEHFVRGGGDVSWPFASYRALLPAEAGIETERIDDVQYAAWHLSRAVLRALPQLAGPEQAHHLGLDGLPSKVTNPMLQLLLADRTPLLERETLRARAMDAAKDPRSATASAEAFRRVPAVRSSLWGVEGSWEDRRLPAAHETELRQLLSSDALAGAVPAELFEAINGAPGRPTLLAAAPARGGEEPAPPRIVVSDPVLRPWLRALLWQHPDVPVVTAGEIGLPP
jgi:hypothetical protein